MDVGAFLQYLRHQRHVIDYMFVSASAVFIYDYILTLHLEIKLVWLSLWTYTKVLFLLIRYLGVINAFLYPLEQTLLDISAETCKVIYPLSAWLTLFQGFFSEAVLCIRTWAVWRRNKTIGVVLVGLQLASLISQCIVVSKLLHSVGFAPPLYLGFRGCFAPSYTPTDLWLNYLLLAIVQAVVLAMMVVSAVMSYQRGLRSELLHVVHRDGVLFYVYLLCLSTLNLIAVLVLPVDLRAMLIPLQNFMYPILTSRIVLNIREVSTQGLPELHTTYLDTLVYAVPLQVVHDWRCH